PQVEWAAALIVVAYRRRIMALRQEGDTMITGIHAILFSQQAEQARAFFADVLGLPSVDAGRGWLIFALPPAELAVHPTEGAGSHELYLTCDDVQRTTEELARRGVPIV